MQQKFSYNSHNSSSAVLYGGHIQAWDSRNETSKSSISQPKVDIQQVIVDCLLRDQGQSQSPGQNQVGKTYKSVRSYEPKFAKKQSSQIGSPVYTNDSANKSACSPPPAKQ